MYTVHKFLEIVVLRFRRWDGVGILLNIKLSMVLVIAVIRISGVGDRFLGWCFGSDCISPYKSLVNFFHFSELCFMSDGPRQHPFCRSLVALREAAVSL